MKNSITFITLILLLISNQSFSQFLNGDFENVSCIYDCANSNTQTIDCVDDWHEYIINGYDPLQNVTCNPDYVCGGDYSIILVEGSGSNGASVMTLNPFFNVDLQGIPQIINLDSKVIADGSFLNSGIRISGTNTEPENAPDINSSILADYKPTQDGICQNISIIVPSTVSNFNYLIFGKGTHTDGETTVIDNVNDNCGGIISISRNCLEATLNFSECISSYEIDDITIDIFDSEGNTVKETIQSTMSSFTFELPEFGTYDVSVSIGYFNTQQELVFIDIDTQFGVDASDCCSNISASFTYDAIDAGTSPYSIITKNFNVYDALNATHKWYVFSSLNQNSGPYTLVNIEESTSEANVLVYDAAQVGLYYTIFHKVIIPDCGRTCDAQVQFSGESLKGNNTELRDEIDLCDVLDQLISECDELDAPINLRVEENSLKWDEVVGATGYNLQLIPNSSPFCFCKFGSINLPWTVNIPLGSDVTSVPIPSQFLNACFKWRVRAICSLGNSPYSEISCFIGNGGGNENSYTIDIYPNPNNGDMNLSIKSDSESNTSLDIYRFDGTLVKSIANIKTVKGKVNLRLDERNSLDSGLYYFYFKTDSGTITKKVFVN